MRLRSFEEMLSEYNIPELESDDKMSRAERLSQHKYSIIVEGDFLEFDNLELWIKTNLRLDSIDWLFYGKIGYDFGFAEYFFEKENQALEVARVVPNVYTTFGYWLRPNRICKSDGFDTWVDLDPANKDAIVFPPTAT